MTSENLIKILQIDSVSYFNLGGLELCLGDKPTKPPRGDGTAYKRLITFGQKQTTTCTLLKARQKSKWKVCEGHASTVHFVVAVESTTNPCYHVFHK